MPDEAIKPSEGMEYYTKQIYWNDFEIVLRYLNVAISGQHDVAWPQHILTAFKRFDTALIVNCGNGWVERDLYKIGLINRAIGIDIGDGMIKEATEKAQLIGLPCQYVVADCNRFSSDDMRVDLVVNHAAMHHVGYINRLTRTLSTILNPAGRYVAFDYVGAHRNQYPWEMWSAVIEFNATLPEPFRQKQLAYPHIKTMLHVDPTEAIHSELQLEVMKRYFEIEQFVPLGGPIAYHILFGNHALFEARGTEEGIHTLQRILAADRDFATAQPHTNLFAFWVAKPKVCGGPTKADIDRWQTEEDEREARAAAQGGRYYPATALEIIYDEMGELRHSLSLASGPLPTPGSQALGKWARQIKGWSMKLDGRFRQI
jgi:SAM-dependent methyltransferase